MLAMRVMHVICAMTPTPFRTMIYVFGDVRAMYVISVIRLVHVVQVIRVISPTTFPPIIFVLSVMPVIYVISVVCLTYFSLLSYFLNDMCVNRVMHLISAMSPTLFFL